MKRSILFALTVWFSMCVNAQDMNEMGRCNGADSLISACHAVSHRHEIAKAEKEDDGYRLDSIVYHEEGYKKFKAEYAYDAQGHTTRSSEYKWSDGEWERTCKFEYAYDDLGHITSYETYSWSGETYVLVGTHYYYYSNRADAIEAVKVEQGVHPRKYMKNGNVFIDCPDGRMFYVSGRRISVN